MHAEGDKHEHEHGYVDDVEDLVSELADEDTCEYDEHGEPCDDADDLVPFEKLGEAVRLGPGCDVDHGVQHGPEYGAVTREPVEDVQAFVRITRQESHRRVLQREESGKGNIGQGNPGLSLAMSLC